MDPRRYVDEIVRPTIQDFEATPTSVRHAFLACVVTFHTIDHLSAERNSQQLREEFRRASKDFAVVDRIAYALKHSRTGHPDSKLIPPLDADEVISRPPGFWGTAVWGLSRWGDTVGGVTIQDEVQLDVMQVVTAAIAFLETRLPP